MKLRDSLMISRVRSSRERVKLEKRFPARRRREVYIDIDQDGVSPKAATASSGLTCNVKGARSLTPKL